MSRVQDLGVYGDKGRCMEKGSFRLHPSSGGEILKKSKSSISQVMSQPRKGTGRQAHGYSTSRRRELSSPASTAFGSLERLAPVGEKCRDELVLFRRLDGQAGQRQRNR